MTIKGVTFKSVFKRELFFLYSVQVERLSQARAFLRICCIFFLSKCIDLR